MVTTAYPNLDDYLRSWGLKVVEVSGWKTRSANTTTFTPRAVICHHTATTAGGNAPTLNYIRDKILSQFVLGRDGTVYIVSGNRANHAGTGGPIRNIPKDGGNRYAWGIEAENNGRGEAWPDVQMKAYVRLAAALCAMMKVSEESVVAHKEYAPSRKIDPAGINMATFRNQVEAQLRAGKGGTTGDPILREGDSGQKVTDIQNALVKHGFLKAAQVDGDFGPTTKGAVVAFQKAKGLTADGVVGQKTWDALRLPAATGPSDSFKPEPTYHHYVTGGNRMLVQFKGDPHVWEVVGSKLYHVTATAWKARGLTSAQVKVVEPTHPLNALDKVTA